MLFEITIQDAWNKFVSQNGLCAISGESLCFSVKNCTASLDRIDNSKHYSVDNIQWVHKTINVMRMDLSVDEFIEWCKKVANYANSK